MSARSGLAIAATVFTVTMAPVAASAAWLSPGAGAGSVTAATLNQGRTPTATAGSGRVSLSWAPSTLGSGQNVASYDVWRHSTTAPDALVCNRVATTSCTDVNPVAGPVTYGVVPRIGTYWTGAESPVSTTFQYDNTAPTTSITRNPFGTDATWNNTDVDVTLTATDPGSPAAGVKEIHYVVDGGTVQTVTGSSVTFTVSAEQVNTIAFWSVDNLGNVEPVNSTTRVRVDKTAPVTSASLSPASNPAGWNNADVNVLLSAVDGPGAATSGVTSTEYSLDGTAWKPYLAEGIPVTAEGMTTVYYRSTDYAGNVELPKTQVVNIDKHAPTSTGSLSGSSLTLRATDTGPSGVARIEYKIGTGSTYTTYQGNPVTLGPGQTAYFHAVDTAGNVESSDNAVTNNADTAGPALAYVGLSDGATYANNNGSANPWSAVCSTGQICVTASDPSGVVAPSVKYTLEATSGNNAGKCWGGSSGWVAKVNGACTPVAMTAMNGRFEGGTISNGNMKAGAYTVTVTAQDMSNPPNVSSVTRRFSIG